MNQTKFTFKSENLVVDWISFKFQKLEDSTKTMIANYLFKLGFNSYQESGKLAKPIKEPILESPNNKFEVLFVKEAPYWEGTLIQFSGSNTTRFYSFVQKKLIHWELPASSTIIHSVVNIILAIDVAFCKPDLVTLAGSTIPSSYIFPKVFLAAL